MFTSRLAALFTAPLFALTLASCDCLEDRTVCGTGPDETETRPITDVTRLSVSYNTEVYLAQGPTPELRLEAPRNVLDVLRTDMVGGELRIGTKDRINLKLKHPVRIYVTLPELTSLSGSGSTNFHGTTMWNVADLLLTLSGASTANLNLAATGALRTEASGASRVALQGSTGHHMARLSGASELNALDLTNTTADIAASGASQTRLTITNSLAVDASGASQVYYRGNPSITASRISGGSRLVKVD